MNESKPVDLEAIRARTNASISTSLNLGDEMDEQQEDCLALCDEVESIRERVKELNFDLDRVKANNIKMQNAIELYEERVKELEKTLNHGCLHCGDVGLISEPTKGDHTC